MHIFQVPTIDKLLAQPEICLLWGIWIAVVAFGFGTVIPGIVALLSEVFYREEMIKKCTENGEKERVKKLLDAIPASLKTKLRGAIPVLGRLKTNLLKAKRPLPKLKEWLDTEQLCHTRIQDLNQQLAVASGASGDTVKIRGLIALRQPFERDLEKARGEILVDPFLTSGLAYVWAVIYTSLAILVFLAPIRSGPDLSPMGWNAIRWAAAGVFLFFLVPLLSRALINPPDGRKVYSFINLDISRASFVMLNINNLVLSVLLGVVWHRWIHSFYIIRAYHELPSGKSDTIYATFSFAFANWQVSSIVLALGFSVFTWLYWKRVALREDKRYFIQAVIIHVLWGVTWCVISLPALFIWHKHPETKTMWNAIVSLLAAATSYVLPLLKKPNS